MSSRDPKKPGGSADWRLQSEQLRHWGLSAGSVLVPGSRGSSNKASATASLQPKRQTPTSSWRGTVVAPRTATERAAAAIFLIAALVAGFFIVAFGVRYRDSVLVGLAGLAATGVVYKIANVALARRIFLFLIVLLGLAATGFAEYELFVGKYFFGTLTEPLWQSIRESWKAPAIAAHRDIAAVAGAGLVLAVIGFFYAQSKRMLAAVPLSIIAGTMAAMAGIAAYQSSSVSRYVDVASALGPKAPAEQNAFTSRVPPPPPKVQSRLPKYATVSNGVAALGLRSCPVTCPIIAWVPTGATVKIIGSGEKGWPEVETTMVGGATFHGFADGTMLR
jgi:hypothetical protein